MRRVMAGLKRVWKDIAFLVVVALVAFLGTGCATTPAPAAERPIRVVESGAAELVADCERLEAFTVRARSTFGRPATENGKAALQARAAADPRADTVLMAGRQQVGLGWLYEADFTGFSYRCG